MKRLLTLALVLASINQVPAQAPRMTVREDDGSSKRLRVEQADMAVRFLGDIAETVLDLRFRNDGERAVEGEFTLPLPEGATVSAYALEVNGQLRAGVAVEKQRARSAYESVKRRMIDPGIVEREAGNIYRTKVYPVPAKGTKRLRISYTETLRPTAQGLAYALPLDFPDALDSFSCNLRGAATGAIRVTAAAGLEFTADAAGELRADHKNVRPAGTLRLVITPSTEAQMVLESDPQPAFFLSARVPEIAPRPRPAPATVMLVWDASGSGLESDHAAAMKLLDSWFAHLGTTRVSLRLLRECIEDGGEFEISNGRWSKLKKALKQVDYDGATALSRLQVRAGQADLVVLVSDGVATLGTAPPDVAVPLVFVHCGTASPPQALGRLTRATGGVVIDLATETPAAALAKLTRQPLCLLGVEGTNLATVVLDQDVRPGATLRILGTLREPRDGKLELRYGFGNDLASTREVIYQPGGQPNGIVRRLHAQRVLAELEQQDHPDPQQIIVHCKRNGLVSDYTSLIVLDRIEDYVEHEIPPPEPELKADYDKRVAGRATHRSTDRGLFGLFAWAWAMRLHDFEQRFPGYEALLQPRLRQIGIWKTALESQFTPAQRDGEAFATVAGWFDKATGLIANKQALRTPDEYRAWRQAIDALQAEGPKLAQTPPHLPPPGQALTVSVRGLVAQPGLVAGEPGMTLRQAVAKAGGTHPAGSLENVAIYRNAGKTAYNTLSARYQDIPLFPGDMLVVGEPGGAYPRGSDPFAAAPEPSDPGTGEPIREEGDLWIPPDARRESFEPADPAGFYSSTLKHRGVPLRSATPWDFAGAGGIATPATPSGRRWRGYSPPELPNQNSPTSDVPPPSASSEVPTSPPPKTEAAVPSVRSEPPAPPVPPELADFARELAAGRDPAAAYRKLTGGFAYQSNFYVAAARILFAKQQVELGRRVLSNLIELRPGDVAALRSYGYWLAEFGQAPEADAVLGTISGDDPAAMQVVFDRASILATNGNNLAAAAGVLSVFLSKLAAYESSGVSPAVQPQFGSLYRYGNLAAAALVEFNAARRELANPAPHPLAHSKTNYRQNLANDIRVVVASTGGFDSLGLVVREARAFESSNANSPSICGGRVTEAGCMQEYTIRHAVPGLYQISCVSDRPATVRALIHRNWGRPDHTFQVVTLLLEGGKSRTIAELEVGFQPPKPE